jgi:hypothetical protein
MGVVLPLITRRSRRFVMNRQLIIRRAFGAILGLGLVVAATGTLPGSAGAQSSYQPSKPDLSIHIDPARSDCNTVRFTVAVSPQANPPSGTYDVKVRVVDRVFGTPTTAYERTFKMFASGHRIHATVDFPMPADRRFNPDFENVLSIAVDPDKEIAESYEYNNSDSFEGTCIG